MKSLIFNGSCIVGLVGTSFAETGDVYHVVLLVIKIKRALEEK